MGNLLKYFIVVGIAFIFIGYGTDKLLQTFTGVTYLQGDTIDNDVVSLRTGMTVIEYDDHILVKQSVGYIRFITAFKYIDNKMLDGLFQDFLSNVLELDLTSDDAGFFEVIKMVLIVSAIPFLIGAIFILLLKSVGRKIFSSWYFVATCFSLLLLFFVTYQPLIDNIATARMLFTYNRDASDATMEILQNAIDKKTENTEQATSFLSAILPAKKEQNEISLYLGDQLKAITSSTEHAPPPNMVNMIHSEAYQKADEQEKKKLEAEQIKQNANELRKLIFWVYSGVDMGEGNSKTDFSAYSQELVRLYFKNEESVPVSGS
ncbi:MAG: hypothetical protein ACQEXB_09140 [Bacillota bacterium]